MPHALLHITIVKVLGVILSFESRGKPVVFVKI